MAENRMDGKNEGKTPAKPTAVLATSPSSSASAPMDSGYNKPSASIATGIGVDGKAKASVAGEVWGEADALHVYNFTKCTSEQEQVELYNLLVSELGSALIYASNEEGLEVLVSQPIDALIFCRLTRLGHSNEHAHRIRPVKLLHFQIDVSPPGSRGFTNMSKPDNNRLRHAPFIGSYKGPYLQSKTVTAKTWHEHWWIDDKTQAARQTIQRFAEKPRSVGIVYQPNGKWDQHAEQFHLGFGW